MFIYSKQQRLNKDRSAGQTCILHVFNLAIGLQIACFFLAVFRTAQRAKKLFSNSFFFKSSLHLLPLNISTLCNRKVSYARFFFSDVTFILNVDSMEYFIARTVGDIRFLFACAGLHIAFSAINHFLLWMDIFRLRYHFLVINKDILTTMIVALSVIGLICLPRIEKENHIIMDFISVCSEKTISTHNLVLPLIELYVSFSLTLFLFFINGVAAFCCRIKKTSLLQKPNDNATTSAAFTPRQRIERPVFYDEADRAVEPPKGGHRFHADHTTLSRGLSSYPSTAMMPPQVNIWSSVGMVGDHTSVAQQVGERVTGCELPGYVAVSPDETIGRQMLVPSSATPPPQ